MLYYLFIGKSSYVKTRLRKNVKVGCLSEIDVFSKIANIYYDTIKREKYIKNNKYERVRDKVGKDTLNEEDVR